MDWAFPSRFFRSFMPPAAQRHAGWTAMPPLGRRKCTGKKLSSHLTLLNFSPLYFLGYNQSTIRNPRVSSFYFYVLFFFFSCQVFDCFRNSRDKYLTPAQKRLRFPLLSSHSVALPLLLMGQLTISSGCSPRLWDWTPSRKGFRAKRLSLTPHCPI